jgi:hypothetical protein
MLCRSEPLSLAVALLLLLAGCARQLSQQQAEDASIEDLRRARAEIVDIGNVDIGVDREPYRERLVMQAGPKLGWPDEDTRRAAKGIAWKGMTRDQLWWSWGKAWKTIPGEKGAETQEWGPWHLGEAARTVTLQGDTVTNVVIRDPPG